MPTRDNTILVITNIPTPYRIPLFNELDRLLDENGMKLKLVFAALGYSRRKWRIDMGECRFDYEVLRSRAFRFKGSESVSFTYPGIFALLRRERPLLTFVAGYSPAVVKLWMRNLFVPTPYVIWSGAVENLARPDPGWKVILRRLLVRSAVGCVAYGSRSKSYLEALGASADKISIAINTVDTEFYRTESVKCRTHRPKQDPKVLIFLGNLARGKRLDLVFRGIKLLSKERGNFVLWLVGEGPERRNLEELAKKSGISEIVHFKGFKQKPEIPRLLGEADCFLFPSEYDVWGLAVVEAMAAGLPCISSVRAGVTDDLIDDGVTGFTVDFEDSQAAADKIGWVLDNPEKARAMGDAAAKFIAENVSLRRSAEGFLQAIQMATRSVTAMSKSTPKPKALFIGPYPPPYAGPEIGMKLFLDSSLKDSFDVIFLNTNVRSDNVNKGRFDHHMILAFFRFFSRLIYLIVRHRPRVAYYPVTATALGWIGRDIWCLLLCRLFGISTVIHFRGSHLNLNVRKFAPWARWLARLSCRKVSLALVQANCLRDQFDGWVPRERVQVLYQAIDTKTYDNDDLENFGADQVLFIGNMTKAKGYCDVVRSIPVVADRFPDIRFLFAGDLGMRERMVFYNQVTGERLVHEQPLDLHDEISSGPYRGNYEHLGVVSGSEKLRLIRDANIFVLPSYSEGFSRALLEAMSMGKPVIYTPVGAHGEVVQDGLHGLLMAPGDVGKLAQNIIRLLEDTDLRKKIALANYRYVRENFEITKIARRMEQFLKEVAQ